MSSDPYEYDPFDWEPPPPKWEPVPSREQELRALLREIALSGVEYEGTKITHVQIDNELWREIQRVAGREKR